MNQIEKYIRLNMDFPNKAQKLNQVLATQKRLMGALLRSKQSEEVKALLISVAEGHDVATETLDYFHTTLQSVANDCEAIIEGAKVRTIIEEQSTLIIELMAAREEQLK